MTDTWFSSSMDSLKDLHIANDLYAYNTLDGTNILLDHNNTIYMEMWWKIFLQIPFIVSKMVSALTYVPRIIVLITLAPILLLSQIVQ